MIDVVSKIIERNFVTIIEEFNKGHNMACYSQRQAGLRKAYDKTNSFLPKDFRKGLSFHEATLFNTKIQILLAQKFKR